jgi:hypothetical protein
VPTPAKPKITWASVWKVLKYILVGLVVVFLIAFAAVGKLNLGGIIEGILGGKNRPKLKINNNPILGGRVVPVLPNTDPMRNKNVLQLADGSEVQLADGVQDTQVRAVVQDPGGVLYAHTDPNTDLTAIFNTPTGS